MSNAILNAVFAHSESRGVARLVLLSLADRADDKGRATLVQNTEKGRN